MKTIQANFTKDTTLLIQGVKGKVSKEGEIADAKTEIELERFIQSFNERITKPDKQH